MFYLFFNAAGYWILAFLFFASIAKAEVFYVTSLRYRGNSKGDITQVVANAWRDACASPWPAKVIIPKGEYYLRGAILAKLRLRFKFKAICVPFKTVANSFSRALGFDFSTLTGSRCLVVELLMAKIIATNIRSANPLKPS